ncbi:MAG: adenosylcobinamide-GDP ribazoletransferase [Candidatus Mariimomonas ferrooxydans]
MKKILLAFQFLTIVPVKGISDVSENEVGKASAFFPLVGFVQGLLLMVSAGLFLKIFPAELVSGLIVLMIILLNGGLHLDGLADTFDAIAARGNKEKKILIMKGSSVGPIGVSAIVLAILLKYLSLNTLFLNSSPITYLSLLLLMPVFSRWIMVPAIFHSSPAKQEGLGTVFIDNTGYRELLMATFLTLFFLSVTLYIVNQLMVSDSQFSVFSLLSLSAFLVLYLFSIISVRFCNKRFGGMTGDTFGAISEISEILFLMNAVLWLKNSI